MNLDKTLIRNRVIGVGALLIQRLEGAISNYQAWDAKLDQDALPNLATSK